MTRSKSDQFGCALVWPTANYCNITIVEDLPKPLREAVLTHERAHCAGWAADHPEN